MDPTPDELDAMAAQVMGWVAIHRDTDPRTGELWFVHGDEVNETWPKLIIRKREWHPSTDLAQAWREFVPVLDKKGCLHLTSNANSHPQVFCDIKYNFELLVSVSGHGETPDAKAAYALTYAFVQAMEPKGYLEWKE